MRHSYRCHVSPDAVRDFAGAESGARLRGGVEEILGTARCPCCRAPLVARMGRCGPYFHCRCFEKEESRLFRGGNPRMQIE